MYTLPVTISKLKRKLHIEVDADKFERLATIFGLFNKNFLQSVDNAEEEYSSGDVEQISSLKDLAS